MIKGVIEMNYINIAEAKNQIARISACIHEPLLLVGGLAVNQYIVTRNSQDIDLICDYDTSLFIVNELYPTYEWNRFEANEDEYRPSFIIKHKTNKNYPTIKFGPKITERGSYRFLNWDELNVDVNKFAHNRNTYVNINIPSFEALCYMKFVSFLGRSEIQIDKLKQDLQDIKDLSNIDNFRLGIFLNYIIKNNLIDEIQSKFKNRLQLVNESFTNCNLETVTKMFMNSVASEENIRNSIKSQNTKSKIVIFDLDGTLIKGIRHSWTLVWNELGPINEIHTKRKKDFYEGKLSYLEWARLDCEELIGLGLTKSHFKKIVQDGKCSLTKNLIPAIKKLRDNDIITAIISGGIDALLYELLPESDELFDDILINKFIFSEDGKLQSISATEYDWDDKKLGTVGKNRGLTRLCEKYNIKIEDSVFVGDDLNDFAAMSSAGKKFFYCGDAREFKTEQLPLGIILMPDNNLLKVADRILSDSTEEMDI